MKHASAAACLALGLCLPLVPARAAESTPADNSLRVRLDQVDRSIGVEPKGHTFHPMLSAGKPEATYIFTIDPSQPEADTLAVFSTDQNLLKTELPLARYRISGLRGGGKIALTLRATDGRLEVSAKDLQHRGAPLTVTRSTRAELAHASLPPTKASAKLPAIAEAPGQKPPAIGEGPTQKKAAGAGLRTAAGLRSGEGTFAPFLREGAAPGQTATVYLHPKFPGQSTADITVYGGESPYLEKDRKLGRYLITGLGSSPKAMFALKFTVTPAGKVDLVEASDSASKKALEVRRYNPLAAHQLRENFDAEGAPAPVAEGPIVARPFH